MVFSAPSAAGARPATKAPNPHQHTVLLFVVFLSVPAALRKPPKRRPGGDLFPALASGPWPPGPWPRRAPGPWPAPLPAVVRYGQEYVLTKVDLTETTESPTTVPSWLVAVRAAESKKAADIKVLDLSGITSFADFFVICTGANQRQVQAIGDEVNLQLKHQAGELPISVEGYNQAEWILADYGDLLVHIFSPRSREYYGLERLWRNAKTVEIPAE